MKRKTSTPQGEPRQGELITLADRMKAATETSATAGFKYPPVLPAHRKFNESYAPLYMDISSVEGPLMRGDMLIFYQTQDIRNGDFAYIIYREEIVIGTVHFSDVWITLARPCGCHVQGIPRYEKSHIEIVGRLAEVQRKGEPISTPLPTRPYQRHHEPATIYQFKRKGLSDAVHAKATARPLA